MSEVLDVAAVLESHRSQFKPTDVEKPIPVTLDVGNLAIFDSNPLDLDELKSSTSEYLQALTRDNVQLLFNDIFVLPTTPVDIGVLVNLPKPTSVLPREKPIPKEKPLTRWEKFAKAKGINKRKKSRMEYDEASDEYKPIWGYKRGNDDTKDWLMEVPDRPDQDVMEDMFTKKAEEKRERIASNKKKQLRNEEAAAKQMGTAPKTGLQLRNERKSAIEKSLRLSKKSTASLGKFDKSLDSEPKTKKHEKRQFEPIITDSKEVRDKSLSLLSKIIGDEEIINTNKAARREIAKQHSEAAASKKRKAGGSEKKSSKKRAREDRD